VFNVPFFVFEIGILGISIEVEPVAIIKFLAVIFLSPSEEETVIVFSSTKEAAPLI
jgi:hypothetical protein